mmetsp:Transcript_30570/g.42169  ORF Transcript_30570/g.42169 Transcript_30570/m.42169 type:complete len:263 (+) Transcript_30570:1365-2153(+)
MAAPSCLPHGLGPPRASPLWDPSIGWTLRHRLPELLWWQSVSSRNECNGERGRRRGTGRVSPTRRYDPRPGYGSPRGRSRTRGNPRNRGEPHGNGPGSYALWLPSPGASECDARDGNAPPGKSPSGRESEFGESPTSSILPGRDDDARRGTRGRSSPGRCWRRSSRDAPARRWGGRATTAFDATEDACDGSGGAPATRGTGDADFGVWEWSTGAGTTQCDAPTPREKHSRVSGTTTVDVLRARGDERRGTEKCVRRAIVCSN